MAAAPTPTPPHPETCHPPPFRPTYLPWLRAGEPVPEPKRARDGRNLWLVWYKEPNAEPTQRWGASLATAYEPPEKSARRHFPAVHVRGVTGRLVWVGDPGVGLLTVEWAEGTHACESFVLGLSTTGMSERQAEAEIVRMAGSLRKA